MENQPSERSSRSPQAKRRQDLVGRGGGVLTSKTATFWLRSEESVVSSHCGSNDELQSIGFCRPTTNRPIDRFVPFIYQREGTSFCCLASPLSISSKHPRTRTKRNTLLPRGMLRRQKIPTGKRMALGRSKPKFLVIVHGRRRFAFGLWYSTPASVAQFVAFRLRCLFPSCHCHCHCHGTSFVAFVHGSSSSFSNIRVSS